MWVTSDDRRCSECGVAQASDAPPGRVCPGCLLAAAVRPYASSAAQPESSLQHLRIVNVIGESAHARVYLGQWAPPADGFAAVKRGRERASVRRSEDEDGDLLRLLQLDHPHIATLFESGLDADGWRYTVTEFVPGTSLVDFCQRHRATIAGRLELLLQVSEALEYAHGHGVEHLNLKSSNVLVEPAGGIKLVDFHAAMPLDSEETALDLSRLCSLVAEVLVDSAPAKEEVASPEDVVTIARRASGLVPPAYENVRQLSSDLAAALAAQALVE